MQTILIYKAIGTGEKQLSAEMFNTALAAAAAPQLRFNSPGGSVFEGNTMISLMEAKTATGLVDGLAGSMAAFLFLSCKKRKMHARGRLMLHLPKAQISGDAEKMRATAIEMDKMRDDFAVIISNAASITPEAAIEKYLQPGKDIWLTAAEALAANLIHEIVGTNTASIPATATAGELHTIYAQLIDTTKKNKMDKLKFIGILGAQANAEMSDEEIYAAVKAAIENSEALTTENTGLKVKIKAFEDAEKEARELEVTALLDEAITAKKITAKQRDNWQASLNNDFENAKAMLEGLTPVPNIKNVPKPEKMGTPAELVARYNEADKAGTLEGIKADTPEVFKAMFKAKFNKDYKED